jgi:hypothetical protein
MASFDIFNDDAFSVTGLTKSINEDVEGQKIPNIDFTFQEEGINTTSVFIEKKTNSLELVPAGIRGEAGAVPKREKAKLIPFGTIHLPQSDGVLADHVTNLRAFGTETELQSVQTVVNQRLAKMRRQLDATITFHRLGAIKGKVLDADGTTELLDIYDAFGLTQQETFLDVGDEALPEDDIAPFKIQVINAKRMAERALGMSFLTGYRVYCGTDFFDSLITHPDVEEAYDRWNDGQFLREDNRPGFQYAGVEWVELSGNVGGVDFWGADEAYLIPVGVPDLFITKFAPADYMETVNTTGLPYYARQEPMPMNKGIAMESQSNVLNLCTKPRAIIKIVRGTSV